MVKKERVSPKDVVLAHAHVIETATRAVILSDDCDIEDITKKGRGRLMVAALVDIPPGERDLWFRSQAFSGFVIGAQPELKPRLDEGKIDFNCVVSVDAADLLAVNPTHVIDDPAKRRDLAIRWAAHSTRHGPAVAAQAARDLAILLTARGDPDKIKALKDQIREAAASGNPEEASKGVQFDPDAAAIIPLLKQLAIVNWTLEGPIVDNISTALEQRQGPDAVTDEVIAALEALGAKADEVLAALRRARAG
jgi:hypothetical protein